MDQQTLSHYVGPDHPRSTALVLKDAAVFAIAGAGPLGARDPGQVSLVLAVAQPARPRVSIPGLRDAVIEGTAVDEDVGRA